MGRRGALRARWHAAGDWLAWFGGRADEMVRPPVGRARELWDTSLFLFGISFVGYVITQPNPAAVAALSAPLRVLTETQLGWIVAGSALFGTLVSYGPPQWLDVGYAVSRIAAWLMLLNFLSGMLLVAVDRWCLINVLDPDLTGQQTEQVLRVAFLYALIFGWAARRLARDNRAWWER